MKKPALIREFLIERTPWLNNDPTRLATFAEKGHIVATGDASSFNGRLCYEHQYTLTLVVLDFPGDPEEIIVPLMEWLTTNQPDFIQNPDWQTSGLKFEVEVIDKHKVDLVVYILLTERIDARVRDGQAAISAERYEIKSADEPQYDQLLEAVNGIDPSIDPTQ